MCGISGFIIKKANNHIDLNVLKKMVSKLSHRGPDNKGFWKNDNNTQFIGHSRLSILDLSERGSQPMKSSSGRYVISYNGEIYNHLEIRKYLNKKKKVNWKSSSDTETILESFEVLGIYETVQRLHGMFAFCVIDVKRNILNLVRDKFGEKPLYYGLQNENFVFASELKSINSFPYFEKKICNKSLNYFFNFSYVPEPLSIYEKIYKLEAGTILSFDLSKNQILKKEEFSTLLNQKIQNLSFQNCVNKFDELFNSVIKDTMISDVEVGSFLSGGLDSSLVTAVMQNQSKKKVKTFSVVFEDLKYNEKFYSKNISEYLNTDHHEILVDTKNLIQVSKNISEIYDEPFADSSQIPTSIISKFASKNVKVILSGDGADELFGGYNRYIAFKKINMMMKLIPYNLRFLIGKIISIMPMNILNFIEISLGKIFSYNRSVNQLDDKIRKLGQVLINSKSVSEMYFSIISLTENTGNLLINQNHKDQIQEFKESINSHLNNSNNIIENIMKLDQKIYLTGDILHKVDRAAMHNSLETRIPFLNPEIVNFSNNLSIDMKIKGNEGKVLLREVLKRYIPEKYVNRPKMGFSIPLKEWLKGPLKKWVLETLDYKRIKNQGYLNEKQIQFYLDNHFSGKKDFSKELWNIIIFQKWFSKYN